MSDIGLILALVTIAALAVVVAGSIAGGLIVATLELGFWGLSRYLKGLRR